MKKFGQFGLILVAFGCLDRRLQAVSFALGHPPTENDPRPLDASRTLASIATFVIFVLTFVAEPFKFVP